MHYSKRSHCKREFAILGYLVSKGNKSMSVQEIEVAITQLPPQKVTNLLRWLEEYHTKLWDEQIEQDLDNGTLDTLLAEVDAEYEAGLAQPL